MKVLFLADPIVDTTMGAARERRRLEERAGSEKYMEREVSTMSRLTGIDFSKLPLDEPLPELTTNGHQSSLARWIGKTPPDLVRTMSSKDGTGFTGTPVYVAGMMQDIMEEVGGDGCLMFDAHFDRRDIVEVCDGLVPALQRRGLTRKAWVHKHFADILMEF